MEKSVDYKMEEISGPQDGGNQWTTRWRKSVGHKMEEVSKPQDGGSQ